MSLYVSIINSISFFKAEVFGGGTPSRRRTNYCSVKLVYYENNQRHQIFHLKNSGRRRHASGFKKIKPKRNYKQEGIQLYFQSIGTCCWRAHKR